LQGYVQVYTGNGKGKTTAAIGLLIRALGAGKRILFLQFMKSKVYSEHAILATLSSNLTVETTGKPFFIVKEGMLSEAELAKWGDDVVVFPPGEPPADYLALMKAGVLRAKEAVANGQYDIVILDEINVALFFGLISLKDVQDVLASKLPTVEVVLTGRGAPLEIIDCADLVTEMQEVKHYYTKGIEARLGIEN
jgi:cob(I)alamin adenosyltransferase